jgi:hypothetical protein
MNIKTIQVRNIGQNGLTDVLKVWYVLLPTLWVMQTMRSSCKCMGKERGFPETQGDILPS